MMTIRFLRWLTIALMLGLSTEAVASPPLLFDVAGKWTLTGDDGRCFLTRKFSHGASILNLRIDQYPRQYPFRMTISFEHRGGGQGIEPARIRLDGTTAKPRSRLPIAIVNESDGVHQAYRLFLIQYDFDDIAKGGYLFVMPSGHVGFQIPVPHLAECLTQK